MELVVAVQETNQEEVEMLKEYLSQYLKKKRRRKILKKRLENLELELLGPKSQKLSPTPRSQTNNKISEPADYCVIKEEIQERIAQEEKEIPSVMLKVWDIINFLKTGTDEKNIIEMKYIDGYTWEEIAKANSMSRSRCIDYWNVGLRKLLQFKKVKKILENFNEETKK